MNTNIHGLKPVFDFADCESSVLIYQGQAEVCIGRRWSGAIELDIEYERF
jgi:hypothetical protein